MSRLKRFLTGGDPAARDWSKADFEAPVDLDDIMAEEPPFLVSRLPLLLGLMFVALIVAAAFARADIIITASGRLSPDATPIVVQPVQLSIIRDIKVRPGDRVTKGQELATLDPTLTEADKAALDAQQAAVAARVARIEAELDGKPLSLGAGTPDLRLQQTIYEQRGAQYEAQLAAIDADIERLRADSTATQNNILSLAAQLGSAKEAEALRLDLFERKLGSKLTFLDAQVGRMRAEREHQDATNHLDQLKRQIESRAAERTAFVKDWRRGLLEELVRARAEAAGVSEGLNKATLLNRLVSMTAPADGVVLDVARRSVGSVLNAGEPLITLIPSDAPLIAEVMIPSADVGYAQPDQEAVVKIDAYPWQRHGTLPGRLRSIGQDSVSDPAAAAGPGGVFHRSQVTLSSLTLSNLRPGSRLIAGMTVTAEIKVGRRSVLSYFLYPIQQGLKESMREP